MYEPTLTHALTPLEDRPVDRLENAELDHLLGVRSTPTIRCGGAIGPIQSDVPIRYINIQFTITGGSGISVCVAHQHLPDPPSECDSTNSVTDQSESRPASRTAHRSAAAVAERRGNDHGSRNARCWTEHAYTPDRLRHSDYCYDDHTRALETETQRAGTDHVRRLSTNTNH